MPRRKKLPDIPNTPNLSGLGRNGKDPHSWFVQKSNPLKSLSETDLNLIHFKILDAYLSRIDSHKPEERYVQFEKGELEQLLGVTRMHRDELDKRLGGLFQAVTIHDERKPKNFVKIGLFAKAECEQDEDGLWQVRLACTAEAMEYIFNIENLGYLRYRLKNVINLNSRYSYILFLYLMDNRFRKTWRIGFEELKSLINCTADRYLQFKFFNSEILKKTHSEINEKTDLRFSYKPVKKGRKVAEIEFTVETIADEITVDQQQSEEQLILAADFEDTAQSSERSTLEFLSGACEGEFDADQINAFFQMICTWGIGDFPNHPRPDQGVQLARYHYLAEVYARMVIESKRKKISNRAAYMIAIIERDREKMQNK